MPYCLAACLIAALLLGVSAARAAPPPSAQMPTPEQIDRAFADGEYAQALRQISLALAARGDMASLYDRHDLLELKGETHLRLKNPAAAADAFDEAARATKDEKKAAVDRATAELLRRAKGLAYTPPVKKGAPAPKAINLTDPAARRDAFAALFRDAKPRVVAAVKSARQSNKLPAILDTFGLLSDLRALELAATGGDTESTELGRHLSSRARTLMARGVKEMAETVSEIEQAASRVYQHVRPAAGGPYVGDSDYVGVSPEERQVLLRIAADCDRVNQLAHELKWMFPGDGDEADALRALRDEADATATRAREVEQAYRQVPRPGGRGHAGPQDFTMPEGQLDQGSRRAGTSHVQRPARKGNPHAGPRGVGTGGVGSGTR